MEKIEKSRLEKISFIILLITIFLTPIAFFHITYAPLDIIKTVVIVIGILLSTLLYLISAFKNKSLNIPQHPLFLTSLLILVSLIISSVSSTNIWKSVIGQGFETGTLAFVSILFISMFITLALTKNNKDRVMYVYGAIISSFIFVVIFHVIRFIFGPDVLGFDIFQTTTSTLLGKWNDIAIYSGVIGIMSLLSLRFVSLNKSLKIFSYIALALSGLILFFVNFYIVWVIVAVIVIGISIYEYSISKKKLQIIPIVIIVIAILCSWKGGAIALPVTRMLGIDQTEIILPWQLSLDIGTETIKKSPLFGAGPNRFAVQYLKFRPLTVNTSPFWSLEFVAGSSVMSTFLVTQGIVGVLLWLVFITIFIYCGYKALRKADNNNSRFLTASTFFVGLFLWITTLLYIPSHTMLFLTFIFTGLSLSVTTSVSGAKGYVLNNRLTKILLVSVTIVVVILSVLYIKKMIALAYFQSGISYLKNKDGQDLEKAEINFKKTLIFDKSDVYYQALSEINILKIKSLTDQAQLLIQQGAKSVDPATISKVGSLVEEGVKYTRNATLIDPTNYYNYLAEARISEIALSLHIQNAYENTKTSYINALKYNPYNPILYLSLARIEATNGKFIEAERYIDLALQLKQNYTDAIFLLSQVQVSQGKVAEAINSVIATTKINPENPLLYFQLGLLYYNNKDYQKAIEALSQAMKLNNQYANAQYFLGLSYARVGKVDDALIQFESLAKTNPDVQEIALILSNLKSGRSPFADANPPVDSKPEKRNTLPLKEKTTLKK